jgi:hypothetical protein
MRIVYHAASSGEYNPKGLNALPLTLVIFPYSPTPFLVGSSLMTISFLVEVIEEIELYYRDSGFVQRTLC